MSLSKWIIMMQTQLLDKYWPKSLQRKTLKHINTQKHIKFQSLEHNTQYTMLTRLLGLIENVGYKYLQHFQNTPHQTNLENLHTCILKQYNFKLLSAWFLYFAKSKHLQKLWKVLFISSIWLKWHLISLIN